MDEITAGTSPSATPPMTTPCRPRKDALHQVVSQCGPTRATSRWCEGDHAASSVLMVLVRACLRDISLALAM